jgi:hypothetical protein
MAAGHPPANRVFKISSFPTVVSFVVCLVVMLRALAARLRMQGRHLRRRKAMREWREAEMKNIAEFYRWRRW